MIPADELAPRVLGVLSEPPARPLALLGRTGTGKTRLLRSVAAQAGRDVVRESTRDFVAEMTEAVRRDRYSRYREAFTGDERPRFLEHVEDLRGLAVTRDEMRRLVEARAARGHCTVLTMTRSRGDADVVEWLASWAELVRVD